MTLLWPITNESLTLHCTVSLTLVLWRILYVWRCKLKHVLVSDHYMRKMTPSKIVTLPLFWSLWRKTVKHPQVYACFSDYVIQAGTTSFVFSVSQGQLAYSELVSLVPSNYYRELCGDQESLGAFAQIFFEFLLMRRPVCILTAPVEEFLAPDSRGPSEYTLHSLADPYPCCA